MLAPLKPCYKQKTLPKKTNDLINYFNKRTEQTTKKYT